MKNNIFTSFDSSDELVKSLSLKIINELSTAIKEKGKASFLVSGGNTPKKLFEKLSTMDIEWDKVSVSLVDERWIETSNTNSNENLVKTYLLKDKASKAKFVSMYIPFQKANDCEHECSKIYEEKLYPFDVLVLGMGNDAHTASLFPNNEKLLNGLDLSNKNLCISLVPNDAKYERMSLTLSGIISARNIFLHIEGEEKLKVYNEALLSNNKYEMPISCVLNNPSKCIEVYYS